MSVGANQDRQAVDQAFYGASVEARNWCEHVDHLVSFWNGLNSTQQQALYPDSTERQHVVDWVASMKSAADAIRGQASPTLPNNFLFAATTYFIGPN